MKISSKAEGNTRRVYLDGRPSPLFIEHDKMNGEWDLCTEQDHIMSARLQGTLLRRLEFLVGIVIKAAG